MSSPRVGRAPDWRFLLSYLGAVSLGVLLTLGWQAWSNAAPDPLAQSARPPATATATALVYAAPWPGCVLLSFNQYDQTDQTGAGATVSHRVTATWVCAAARPPAPTSTAAPK